MGSLPSRERGLKFRGTNRSMYSKQSLPSRERGLKFVVSGAHRQLDIVAPLAGAWIEIGAVGNGFKEADRRSPRGSVD